MVPEPNKNMVGFPDEGSSPYGECDKTAAPVIGARQSDYKRFIFKTVDDPGNIGRCLRTLLTELSLGQLGIVDRETP